MNKINPSSLLHRFHWISAISSGILFIVIAILGGIDFKTGSYPVYPLYYPQTLILKILDTLLLITAYIFLSFIFFLNGVTRREPSLEVKLIINRSEVQTLIRNSKFKKIILYLLFLGFSITTMMIVPFVTILDFWYPNLISNNYVLLEFAIFSIYLKYLFIIILPSYLLVLYLNFLFIREKSKYNLRYLKKKILKKHFSRHIKINSPDVMSKIFTWIDKEVEKKFTELIGLLPKRYIIVPEDLKKIHSMDDNSFQDENNKS